jgi:hypothetical protein
VRLHPHCHAARLLQVIGACSRRPRPDLDSSGNWAALRGDTPAGADQAPRLSRPPDHVGCHPNRSMRPTICPKRRLVKWPSAS